MAFLKKYSLILKVGGLCGALACMVSFAGVEFATKKKKTIASAETLKQECGHKCAAILELLPCIDKAVGRLLSVKAELQLAAVDTLSELLNGSSDAKTFLSRATKADLLVCTQQLAHHEQQLEKQMVMLANLEKAVGDYCRYVQSLREVVVEADAQKALLSNKNLPVQVDPTKS